MGLLTILLCVIFVFVLHCTQGSAMCPQDAYVSQLCIPSVQSGPRVLIDMSTATTEIQDCECLFTTTANTVKLMSYSAPNYPKCGTAVDISTSTGTSTRFDCMATGSFFDMTNNQTGSISLERLAPPFDQNYCLILEHAGEPWDSVTVDCRKTLKDNSTTSASVTQSSIDFITKTQAFKATGDMPATLSPSNEQLPPLDSSLGVDMSNMAATSPENMDQPMVNPTEMVAGAVLFPGNMGGGAKQYQNISLLTSAESNETRKMVNPDSNNQLLYPKDEVNQIDNQTQPIDVSADDVILATNQPGVNIETAPLDSMSLPSASIPFSSEGLNTNGNTINDLSSNNGLVNNGFPWNAVENTNNAFLDTVGMASNPTDTPPWNAVENRNNAILDTVGMASDSNINSTTDAFAWDVTENRNNAIPDPVGTASGLNIRNTTDAFPWNGVENRDNPFPDTVGISSDLNINNTIEASPWNVVENRNNAFLGSVGTKSDLSNTTEAFPWNAEENRNNVIPGPDGTATDLNINNPPDSWNVVENNNNNILDTVGEASESAFIGEANNTVNTPVTVSPSSVAGSELNMGGILNILGGRNMNVNSRSGGILRLSHEKSSFSQRLPGTSTDTDIILGSSLGIPNSPLMDNESVLKQNIDVNMSQNETVTEPNNINNFPMDNNYTADNGIILDGDSMSINPVSPEILNLPNDTDSVQSNPGVNFVLGAAPSISAPNSPSTDNSAIINQNSSEVRQSLDLGVNYPNDTFDTTGAVTFTNETYFTDSAVDRLPLSTNTSDSILQDILQSNEDILSPSNEDILSPNDPWYLNATQSSLVQEPLLADSNVSLPDNETVLNAMSSLDLSQNMPTTEQYGEADATLNEIYLPGTSTPNRSVDDTVVMSSKAVGVSDVSDFVNASSSVEFRTVHAEEPMPVTPELMTPYPDSISSVDMTALASEPANEIHTVVPAASTSFTGRTQMGVLKSSPRDTLFETDTLSPTAPISNISLISKTETATPTTPVNPVVDAVLGESASDGISHEAATVFAYPNVQTDTIQVGVNNDSTTSVAGSILPTDPILTPSQVSELGMSVEPSIGNLPAINPDMQSLTTQPSEDPYAVDSSVPADVYSPTWLVDTNQTDELYQNEPTNWTAMDNKLAMSSDTTTESVLTPSELQLSYEIVRLLHILKAINANNTEVPDVTATNNDLFLSEVVTQRTPDTVMNTTRTMIDDYIMPDTAYISENQPVPTITNNLLQSGTNDTIMNESVTQRTSNTIIDPTMIDDYIMPDSAYISGNQPVPAITDNLLQLRTNDTIMNESVTQRTSDTIIDTTGTMIEDYIMPDTAYMPENQPAAGIRDAATNDLIVNDSVTQGVPGTSDTITDTTQSVIEEFLVPDVASISENQPVAGIIDNVVQSTTIDQSELLVTSTEATAASSHSDSTHVPAISNVTKQVPSVDQTTKKLYAVVVNEVVTGDVNGQTETDIKTNQVQKSSAGEEGDPSLFGVNKSVLIIILAIIGGAVLLLIIMGLLVNQRRKKRMASAPITNKKLTVDNIVYDRAANGDPEKMISGPLELQQTNGHTQHGIGAGIGASFELQETNGHTPQPSTSNGIEAS